MFTDVVGYTSTIRRDEEAGRRVRAQHRAVVENAVSNHEGTLLQYFGDGSLSIFPSAVEAAAAAVEIQKDFLKYPESSLRIGIDLGDVAYDEQGVYGDAVNVASRLESISEPGAILISGKLRRELQNHPNLQTIDLGEVRLRNIDAPVPIFALRDEDLPPPDVGSAKVSEPRPGPKGAELRPVAEVVDDLFERIRRETATHVEPGFLEDPLYGRLPLVGREAELDLLESRAARAAAGAGQTILMNGERGVGKSRLSAHLAEGLVDQGWLVARGQAYPTEQGVPFAIFSDSLGPVLGGIAGPELRLLTQGGEREMSALWPPLARGGGDGGAAISDATDPRSRLFWTVSEFLGTLSSYRPLLLILEDLQWADASSLDLVHFVARQIPGKRILVLCPFCEAEVDSQAYLTELIQSLLQIRSASRMDIDGLTQSGTHELVTRTFGVEPRIVDRFSNRLFEWTRGNSFFLEGTLRGLVETGQLRRRQTGWMGWEVEKLELPATVRDAVLFRIGRLPSEAREVADLAAVMGGQVRYDALRAVSDQPDAPLLSAVQELTGRGVLRESVQTGETVYGFSHPLIPEIMVAELSRPVAAAIHARVARSLEAHFGADAESHVDELAYHYSRAAGDFDSGRAIHYLMAAGLRAMDRNAHSEAIPYLEAALTRFRAGGTPVTGSQGREPGQSGGISARKILEPLAQAKAYVGDPAGAIDLWNEALRFAEETDDCAGASDLYRRIGKTHFSQGRLGKALQAFRTGLAKSEKGTDQVGEAKLRLVQGVCLQQAGRSVEALRAVEHALGLAEAMGDRALLAKVKRGLLLIHMWNGELDLVREGGLEVRNMASDLGDPQLSFWSEWTLAATDGLRGDTEGLRRRVEELDRIAERLRSPSLSLWATELSLEHAYATGAWDHAIGIGEQAAALGRALKETPILPRILVWLSLIYGGRGDLVRAGDLVEEAWETSGADGVARGVELLNVHTVVPAHIGRAAYLSAKEDWVGCVEVATAGLEVADRTGYVIWGIHHLLPLLAVAYLYLGRIDEAEEVGARLREYGTDLDHELARAWAGAAEALVAWLRGDAEAGARLLSQAVEDLEQIPMVFDSARLRRQIVGPLMEIGERDRAFSELRKAHQALEKLGAELDLARTLDQYEEYGLERRELPPD
jgi:tetratricopeptide (TPR) repeat protein